LYLRSELWKLITASKCVFRLGFGSFAFAS
jgi:hypothetical protein